MIIFLLWLVALVVWIAGKVLERDGLLCAAALLALALSTAESHAGWSAVFGFVVGALVAMILIDHCVGPIETLERRR